jgi:phosphoglycolate phosphatase
MKKLAIFDFDGTLFDSIEDVIICFNKTLTLYEFPTLTREEIIPCLGGNIDEIISLVLGKNNNPQNLEMVKDTYLNFYNSSKKEKTVPFPFTKDLLNELVKKDVKLAINSNRLNYSLEEFVNRYFEDFDFVSIEGHDLINPSKPHPHGVNKIIEKAGVSLDEAIYIGDSSTDILTAKNAGIDCLIVKWGYGNQKDFENDYVLDVVENFNEILNYF